MYDQQHQLSCRDGVNVNEVDLDVDDVMFHGQMLSSQYDDHDAKYNTCLIPRLSGMGMRLVTNQFPQI